MPTLVRRDDVAYEGQTIYATGFSFFKCEFRGCAIVFSGFPAAFVNCKFVDCVWHLNFTLHDPEQAAALSKFIDTAVKNSLPRPAVGSPALGGGSPASPALEQAPTS